MSSDETPPETVREPRPGRLITVGLVVLIAAGMIVANGIRGRAKGEQAVALRTIEQSVPTVQVTNPQRGAPARALVLPGDIEAYATASIYARASGYVTAWYKDIGDKVKRGEKLAEIDTPDLDQQYVQAKADVASAEANAVLATATAKRYHQLVGQSIVSLQTDEEKTGDAHAKQAMLASARANLARLEALETFKSLVVPFDGVVTTRSIDVGALINAGGTSGKALYQIADLHRVRVYVHVPQAFVGELTDGMKATLRIPQYPDRSFEARLVGTSNSISQDSRTALVQLQADNPEGKLWPGTYTEVHFQLAADPQALRIPATALMFGEHGIRVAAVDHDNSIVLKRVQLGRDIGSDVEILAGLAPSDLLVDSPLETFETGDKVKVVGTDPVSAAKVAQADGQSPPKAAPR